MARPGIMLYFDIRQPLKVLPDADKGRLFDAILEYGEFGVVPEFEGMLAMAWGFIQPKLDRDGESYENTIAQRKYAAFCKKLGNMNLPKVTFEEWKGMTEFEREQMVTVDNDRNPTTAPTITPSITPSISTSTTPSITPAAKGTGSRPRPGESGGSTDFETLRRQRIQMLQEGG